MEIIRFQEIDSTNSYGRRNLARLRHGQVLLADRQSRGRGRLGRYWHSGSGGNLCLSLVLKAEDGERAPLFPPPGSLTLYAAVKLCCLISQMGLSPGIKWPNDVLLEGRKVAGILGESVGDAGCLQGIILGIGVNLNMRPEEIEAVGAPATSLNLHLGLVPDRDSFCRQFLCSFFADYDDFCRQGFGIVRQDYDSFDLCSGRRVALRRGEDVLRGIAAGVQDDGALLIIDDHGRRNATVAGELRFISHD